MNKLWIYGDSYAAEHKGVEWQWYKDLAAIRKLDYESFADYGVANEWICMKFIEDFRRGMHTQGDTVIVVTTHADRHWFLWDLPSVSNYASMKDLPDDNFQMTAEQMQAIELYYKHIQSGYTNAWKYDATTAWWNAYALKLRTAGVNLIVIPGFSNTTDILHEGTVSVRGSLFEAVCTPEFKNQSAMDKYYARPIPDQRVNHMLRDNHHVLAEALNTCLTDHTTLDLDKLPWIINKLSVSTEPMLKGQLSPKLLW